MQRVVQDDLQGRENVVWTLNIHPFQAAGFSYVLAVLFSFGFQIAIRDAPFLTFRTYSLLLNYVSPSEVAHYLINFYFIQILSSFPSICTVLFSTRKLSN